MLLSTENFKSKTKSEFTLNVIALKNEIVAFATNIISKEIEAFDKVGNVADLSLHEFQFSDVSIFITNDQFTLVPESIFDESKASAYINFSTETIEDCEIMISKNNQYSLNTVWYLNSEFKKKITQYWPESTFSHLISHRLENINENTTTNTLFVDFLKGSLNIILFTNHELQIANQFEVNGDEDALYYLLLTLEQAKVKMEELEVHLSSSVSFKEKLNKYFKKISSVSSKKCSLQLTEEDRVTCTIL